MNAGRSSSTTWGSLGGRAKAWRVAHATWSVAQMGCLGYVWACAVRGRRDPLLWGSVGFLVLEGGALVVGGGNCPVGPLQAEWGDPVPFFELLLPPRAAKAAIPVLTLVALSGIGAILVRKPGLVARSEAAPAARLATGRRGPGNDSAPPGSSVATPASGSS